MNAEKEKRRGKQRNAMSFLRVYWSLVKNGKKPSKSRSPVRVALSPSAQFYLERLKTKAADLPKIIE